MGNLGSKVTRDVLIYGGISGVTISILYYIYNLLKAFKKDPLEIETKNEFTSKDQNLNILIDKMKKGSKMRVTIVTNEVIFISFIL